MTERKTILETKRPWRTAGVVLRQVLRCPVCMAGEPKVIAYRTNTTRLECAACSMRFSVNPLDVANTLRMRTIDVLASLPEEAKTRLGVRFLIFGKDTDPEELDIALELLLRGWGTRIGFGALSKPDDTPSKREERLRPLL